MKKKIKDKLNQAPDIVLQIIVLIELFRGNQMQALIIVLLLISHSLVRVITHLEMIRKIKTLNYREKHFDY